MNDRDRAEFEQQQADNTEVEHILLTPFRLFFSFFKWGALISAVIVWTVCVWVFHQLGGESMEKREAVAKHILMVQFNFPNAPDTDWDSNILGPRQAPHARL